MYAKWNKWDGKPLKKVPLFYCGIDSEAAKLLCSVSNEVIAISKCIELQTNIKLEVPHLEDWFIKCYHDVCGDTSSLFTAMVTSHAHRNSIHPMTKINENKEEYVPNWYYRYLSEDVPFGLAVIRGLSLILNKQYQSTLNTTEMDKIIKWTQKVFNKEYFKYCDDGTVVAGKDINETRAPQRYHIKRIEDLVDCL